MLLISLSILENNALLLACVPSKLNSHDSKLLHSMFSNIKSQTTKFVCGIFNEVNNRRDVIFFPLYNLSELFNLNYLY